MVGARAGGPGSADEFEIGSAFIETMLLLNSSFTCGMASLSLKRDHRLRAVMLWLTVTMVLGLAFLGMKINEFVTMVSHGAVAGRSAFLSGFFVLVGVHGLHVTTGVLWIAVMPLQLATIGRGEKVRINLIRLSLFWHFLDMIWVVIFSVVHLQGLITPAGPA